MNTVFSPIVLLGGAGMILVALGFFIYAGWQRLGWRYVAFGALAWVVTVAVKIAWALPMNSRIYTTLTTGLPNGIGAGLFDLYVGFLTGITEIAIVWLVLRYTRLGRVTWERALAFGIGFGAVEALLLGISSLAGTLVALLAPQMLPAEALTQLAVLNNPLYGVAPIAERFFTIWVHILSNVLIFYAVAKKQVRWFWLSFAFKSGIDAVAGYAQTSGVIATLQGLWAIEAIVIIWGIAGFLGTRWVKKQYALAAPVESPARNRTELVTTALLVLGFIVLTAGVVLAVLPNSGLAGSEREAVLAYSEAKTTNLMEGLNNNDYAVFSRDLNDKMKSAVPAEGLRTMRLMLNAKVGNYVSRRVDSVVESGDFVTVIYSARFENEDPVTLRVSFEKGEPHRIAGIWYDSPKLRKP